MRVIVFAAALLVTAPTRRRVAVSCKGRAAVPSYWSVLAGRSAAFRSSAAGRLSRAYH